MNYAFILYIYKIVYNPSKIHKKQQFIEVLN